MSDRAEAIERSPPRGCCPAPVDGSSASLVGVLLQPAANQRAGRDDGESLRATRVDGGPHEPATYAPTGERFRDLGVDEHQAVIALAIDEEGRLAVTVTSKRLDALLSMRRRRASHISYGPALGRMASTGA